MNAIDVGQWKADWAWSLPLIILNLVIHVVGLGLIRGGDLGWRLPASRWPKTIASS
jgi:hypothetical protein